MDNTIRLNKVLRELNITTSHAADILANKGQIIDPKPTTKLTEQQVELLRKELQQTDYKYREIIDFEIGHHYDFVIKENRDNFTIVNFEGNPTDTFTSQRVYQQPGDKIKLFVKKFKDNGEPILTYSVLNSYRDNDIYLFNAALSPRQNGYLLENNEYHEHFVPLSFKSLIEDGTIKLKVSQVDKENNKLIFDDSALSEIYENPLDDAGLINGQDYKFTVIGFKEDYNGEERLVKIRFNNKEYTTRAFASQLEYGLPKWVYCTVNKDQHFRLYQNVIAAYQEIFEINTSYTFKIIDEGIDHNEAPYYIVKDEVGFTHRLYKNQVPVDVPPRIEDTIKLIVLEINEKSKHLRLDWYQKDIDVQREFYSPERIFKDLDGYSVEKHLYNLQEFIDFLLDQNEDERPPSLELFSQIEKENNNWFFSYLSLLSLYNNSLITQQHYEDAKQFIQLYIDLEEWLLESDFIAEYSQSKKQEIIDNAENIAGKQEDLLRLISDLEGKRHLKKFEKIYSKLKKHNLISSRDLKKTIEYLRWDRTLLINHYELIYGIIHALLDINRLEAEDLYFLNRITTQAYESTFASRNFILSSGVQKFSDLEREEIEVENKHLLIQIRLNEVLGLHQYAVMKSSELLRNCGLLSHDAGQKKKFLLQSIEVIIKEVAINELSTADFQYNSELLIKLETILNVNSLKNSTLFYFKSSGVIIKSGQGWSVSNQAIDFNTNLESNDTLRVLLSLYNGLIKVVTTKEQEASYKELEPSSKSFWGSYINNRKTLKDDFLELTSSKLTERHQYIRGVIKSMDYLISLEDDISKKIEALQTAKLITVILRDNKSFYYNEMLQLYYRINGLRHSFDKDNFSHTVNEETLEKFPVLEKIQSIHSLINLIGNPDLSVLIPFLENENSNIKSITKIILAYNNVISEFPDQIEIGKKLLSLIEATMFKKALFIESTSIQIDNVSIESKELSKKQFRINEGREDIVTEFKTSIVYHPGSLTPEIEKQTAQIVKVITGFLNARGGKMYIGIKDSGHLVGLESDYKQLEVNSDGYERILRSFIVKLTNATVNGMLEFKFLTEESLEYLEIDIPAYQTLVDFKGEFYQRQGTETRLIKGQDLSNLFQKKLSLQTSLKGASKELKDEFEFASEKSNVYKNDKIATSGLVNMKEGLYKLGIYDDRTWLWSDADKDLRTPINFTITNKNSFILICYSEGRLAKFRTRSFLSRNKNEIQRNTFALRQDSEIVNIFEIDKDRNFLVQISFSGNKYLKIINSSEAGEVRNRLGSQGTYFVDSNNDGILSIIPIDLEDLKSLQYAKLQMSKQTLGIESKSAKIAELVVELKVKNLI